jgi:endoglucanase
MESERTIMSRRSKILMGAALGCMVIILVAAIALVMPGKTSASTTPSDSAALATITAAPPVPALVVRDRQIYTTAGTRVTLIGASHSSLEYACQGDGHLGLADFQAMRAWGMNVVRLPLWSRFWLNTGNSCPGYQQTLAAAVANAEAAHLYVILDLQWTYAQSQSPYMNPDGTPNYQFPMPDNGEAMHFWQQVAARYKDDPRILFDLYGEPNSVTWQTWYGGGSITTTNGTYQAIGMRALVDVVRHIAPQNVIIINGLDWGYDLSQVGTTYRFPEKNLLFGTHPFDHDDKQLTDFDRAFGTTASRVAVIATEFGAYDCTTDYITSAISYFNLHHISWLAWAWVPSGCSTPSLLKSWDGTPSQPYGAYIQQQMLAMHAPAP